MTSPLSSVVNVCLPSFFMVSQARALSILLIFTKNQLLSWFGWFCLRVFCVPFHWYLQLYDFFSLTCFIWHDSFLPCFLRRKPIHFESFLLSNTMTFSSINSPKHCLCIHFCQRIFSFRLVQNLFKLLLKLPLWPFFKNFQLFGDFPRFLAVVEL